MVCGMDVPRCMLRQCGVAHWGHCYGCMYMGSMDDHVINNPIWIMLGLLSHISIMNSKPYYMYVGQSTCVQTYTARIKIQNVINSIKKILEKFKQIQKIYCHKWWRYCIFLLVLWDIVFRVITKLLLVVCMFFSFTKKIYISMLEALL